MSTRPSEMLGLEDAYLSYCLDEAVAYVGRSIEREIESIEHKKPKVQAQRREARLLALLDIPQVHVPGRFRSPG